MTRILVTDGYITAKGHAGKRTDCTRLSTLTDFLLNIVEDKMGVPIRYHQDFGLFHLDRKSVPDGSMAAEFVDAYIYGVRELAEKYPNSFRFIDERTNVNKS